MTGGAESAAAAADPGTFSVARRPDGALVIRLAGVWRLHGALPALGTVERALASTPPPHAVAFEGSELGAWDSALVTFLARVRALCRARGVEADASGLPAGVQRLVALAEAVPEKKGARNAAAPPRFLARVGAGAVALGDGAAEFLAFLGEATIATVRFLGGRAHFRGSDLALIVQRCGADALPIVTLISFLVGNILAFVGAVQLEKFGASIYVADLVGIAMVREMGAMMTGIVMAGRTGAAFAAELGTMKVTQELDAFRTMGIAPMEFLVLPRMVALALMMPLLCLYSDLVGVIGGAVVGTTMLDLPAKLYYDQTIAALTLKDLVGGVGKASVYGVLVAIAGCLRGMQCGNSSSAVGDAATSAVVTSIVLIITACGLFAVLFYILGI